MPRRPRVTPAGGGLAGFPGGDPGAVDPAHLPGADSDGCRALRIDDGIRLHVLSDAEGKDQVGGLRLAGRAAGHHLEIPSLDASGIAVLHEEAAGERAEGRRAGGGVGQAAGQQQPQVLLGGEHGPGLGRRVGGDDDLGEDGGDPGCGFGVERAVQRHDAPESADRVAGECRVPGCGEVGRRGDAAGVGVFDDDDGGFAEFSDAFEGGVGIVEVVVGEFLPLGLGGGGHAGTVSGDVEGGVLVRVLAVAQRLSPQAADGEALGEALLPLFREPCRDGGVIGCCAGIGRAGQAAAERDVGAAGGQGCRDLGILGGVGQDRDEIVVLGSGADQRGSADVYVLDGGFGIGAGRDRRLEGVEVDGHEIDGRDAVRRHLGEVVAVVAPAEDAAMDLRHQRLHPSVHDLGKAGVVGDIDDAEPGVAQRAGGAAGGENLGAGRGDGLGEGNEPGLVRDGDEGAADGDDVRHRGSPAGAAEIGRWRGRRPEWGAAGQGSPD